MGGLVTSAATQLAVPGFAIIGAHTDSPCLKIKPKSKREKVGYLQVRLGFSSSRLGLNCMEVVYGTLGMNLYLMPRFDRDLSIAGRVLVKRQDGTFTHELLRINRPILRIPNLAIHLDRGSSDSFTFNKEVHLTPVLAIAAEKELNKTSGNHHPILLELIAKELNAAPDMIQDFELCLYDTQPSAIGGANNEFIFAARLDNLMMSFCGIEVT